MSQTFDTANSTSTYTVPSGVEKIRFTVEGASGNAGNDSDSGFNDNPGGGGGQGGYAQGTLSVSPGESFTVYVGAIGSFNSDRDLGGSGGASPWFDGGDGGDGAVDGSSEAGGGGGGGGATGVVQSGTTIIAAGGGGGGAGGSTAGGESGGGGGGGARGGAAGTTDTNATNPGTDGTAGGGSGVGGAGGDATDGAAGGGGGDGGGVVAGSLSQTTTTVGGSGLGRALVTVDTAPPAPSLSVASKTATSITVDIGGTSDEDSAELEVRETGGTYSTVTTYSAGVLPTTETISGLKNGTQHDIRITASNSIGSGSRTTTDTTVLPAPTNLATTSVTDSSISVSWTANHTNGDTRVERRENNSGTWTTDQTVDYTTETATLAGLLNGELYGIRVVADTGDASTVDQ